MGFLKKILNFPTWEWVLFASSVALFVFWPEADIAFQGLFYRPGEGFFLAENIVVRAVYHSVPVLAWITGAGLIAALIGGKVLKLGREKLSGRAMAFLALSLALGPGLLVNGIFKTHWGRARPRMVSEFGGEKEFSRAFAISDQCARNCSFVSGHSSLAFFFVSFGLLARRRRREAIAAAVLFGSVVGLGRVLQGGHFLSDVVFSGFLTCFTAQILYNVMIRSHYLDPTPFKQIRSPR